MKANKKVIGAAGLAAILVVGGSFAYFNQTMTVNNPFDTGKYDTNVTEDFDPTDGKNWEPGATVNKDVEVNNTGKYDVLVRVKFTEKWVNKDSGVEIAQNTTGLKGDAYQTDATDGLTTGDYSVVKKTLNDANWVYNNTDGYWYYKNNLKAGGSTGIFLDAVTLLEDADMGKYVTTNYYTTATDKTTVTEYSDDVNDDATKWVKYDDNTDGSLDKAVPDGAKHSMSVTKLDANASGYGNANYTLTVTTQTVQATDAAMKDAFGLSAALPECNWILDQNK